MEKIPTLFVRDFENSNGRYVTRTVNPGCEWVLAGEGVPTRKWDGTCVLVDEEGVFWARREVKPGKPAPAGFRPISTDATTGKAVGWEPAEQSSFGKYIDEARAGLVFQPATYELVGPKVNGNPDQFNRHLLVPHGNYQLEDVPRDYDGLRAYLQHHSEMEGIVFWLWTDHNDSETPDAMVKIKRRDFPTEV